MKGARYTFLAGAVAAALISCAAPSTLTLYSDSSLDGSVVWNEDGSYGGSFSGASVSIGDTAEPSAPDHAAVTRCLVSFDVSALPPGAQIDSVTLRMYQNADTSGDSYNASTGLDYVLVDNISYTISSAWDDLWGDLITPSGNEVGTLASSYTANTWHTLDVTDVAKDEVGSGKLQFRIQHHIESNHDAVIDTDGWTMGESATNKPELVIVYR